MIYLKKNFIPLFSVVLTTFNRRAFLERATKSLLNQTEKDWECLIVDDGSKDKSFEFAINLCKKDNRFRYIFNQNLGQVAAKNIGIKNSSGNFVTFLDSDDEYQHDHLESRKILLNDNPEIDFLHGGFQVIGEKKVPDLSDSSKYISLEDCMIGGTFFIRRSKLIEINGFDISDYGEDAEFYLKAKNNKLTIAETTHNSYIYHREHENSITKNENIS
jgi:glycosyltransferase involved in cell wall biosynthesis